MENLLFSLNATIPIFLVMFVGWILKQKGMFDDNFISVSNKFNFNVTLPILLFQDMSNSNIREKMDIKFVLYCAIVTSLCFFLIWIGAKIFIKDKDIIGSFVQGSFRGSAAVLGTALIQNMYGNSGMAPLMMISVVPLYNIYSVIVLTLNAKHRTKDDGIKKAFINVCKNPIIIGILSGFLFSYLEIPIPDIVNKTLKNFSSIATPLALIAIGAGFEGTKALKKFKPTIASSFIKLILQTIIFLPIAIIMGFRDEKLIAILIMLSSPSTVSCYIMAKNMDNDDVLASSIVVVTTLASAFTITAFIYILKFMSFI